ncbi:response regulator [Lampropedia aestuarii]|uniref:Response regulator n=1 Tax=Lampropedia aestuarii TaxID=2562762 RepID=A0A4S5BM47_9BURK|nr:response regulator [Lampropedia aestuarii]MDH5857998.1 response regulator [Lampropedia aestuarii]THJ33647.1 response regulator [Lampropedia aestuarii]
MTIQKVLVVDDSRTEQAYLSDLLQKQGMSVLIAGNADEAMLSIQTERPDLILMDVVMPGKNGFQLTRTITKDPVYADIPIIICTSKGQDTDKVWGMRQGAKGYLVKPVKLDELESAISALREGGA